MLLRLTLGQTRAAKPRSNPGQTCRARNVMLLRLTQA
jgi:hypothetical protein